MGQLKGITLEGFKYPLKDYDLDAASSRCISNELVEETEDERANTRIAAQHAGTVLKLNTQKKISNVQIASRHRDEFVQDLFLGRFSSLEQIHSRARAYNWHFQGGCDGGGDGVRRRRP